MLWPSTVKHAMVTPPRCPTVKCARGNSCHPPPMPAWRPLPTPSTTRGQRRPSPLRGPRVRLASVPSQSRRKKARPAGISSMAGLHASIRLIARDGSSSWTDAPDASQPSWSHRSRCRARRHAEGSSQPSSLSTSSIVASATKWALRAGEMLSSTARGDQQRRRAHGAIRAVDRPRLDTAALGGRCGHGFGLRSLVESRRVSATPHTCPSGCHRAGGTE